MPKNKTTSLSEALGLYAPQGSNDKRWFLIEHQLEQARMSVEMTLSALTEIRGNPENAHECLAAKDCYDILRDLRLDVLEKRATFLSYLSNTDVSERISRKEL